MSSQASIAIVGAGTSGLAAAVELVRRGERNITIFEARREAGGRTRSYIDPATGDVLDNGQHIMMGCYTATRDYLRTIGSDHLLQEQLSLSIPFTIAGDTTERSLRLPASLPSPANLLAGLLGTDLLTPREKLAGIHLGNAIRRNKLPTNFSAMTCLELFEVMGQPSGIVRKLWEPIVLATINARPAVASAGLFFRIMREAFFALAGGSRLLFPKAGLSDILIEPAMNYLRGKICGVKTGEPIRNLALEDGRIQLTSERGVSQFDSLIWAAPIPSFLEQILGLEAVQPQYSPIVNAYFWLSQIVLNAPIRAFIGTTLQWGFSKPSSFAAELVALTVSAADELSELENEQITRILWNDLQRSLPDARNVQLIRSQIIKEKRATPVFTPELQSKRRSLITRYANMILAGDSIQNGLPATIEGAVRNGQSAAKALIENRRNGISRQQPIP